MEQGFATIPRSLLHDPAVPPAAKLVYLTLSSHVGGKASAWPSHKRMGELLGISRSSVKRQLVWLKDKGFIDWSTRLGSNGERTSNEYVLLAGSAPENDHGSHRARGGSGRAKGGSDRTTPQVSVSDPLVPSELTEEESLNESQGTILRTSEVVPIRQDVERICEYLAAAIETNGSKRPRISERWRMQARLLLDADERTEEQVMRAIDWSQQSEFWRANILSMPKLREKYDQMRLQAQQRAPNGRQTETDQLFERAAKRMGVI